MKIIEDEESGRKVSKIKHKKPYKVSKVALNLLD